jgi:hypothetical protein
MSATTRSTMIGVFWFRAPSNNAVSATYRIRVHPQRHHGLLQGLQPLSGDSLVNSIEGVVVRELVQGNHGELLIDVRLQRPSHEQALNEILIAVQELGYSWLQATITEWADNALGGFVLGGLGCGAAGASSGNSEAGVFLALVGAVVGAVIGSCFDSVKVVYEVHWTPSGWHMVEVSPQQAPASGSLPRLA